MIASIDTAPALPALDWNNEVKGHLRLDADDEQARVMDVLVPAAEEWAQSLTGRQLITATWLAWYPSFYEACRPALARCATGTFPTDAILVPRPPLQSVTWIKYYDTSNVLQTWASTNYTVKAPAGPKAPNGWIQPVPNVAFPATFVRPDAVEVKFVAGYGAEPTSVPGGLRQAMLLVLAEMFEKREISVTGTIIQDVPLAAVNLGLSYLAEV